MFGSSVGWRDEGKTISKTLLFCSQVRCVIVKVVEAGFGWWAGMRGDGASWVKVELKAKCQRWPKLV